MVPGIKIEKSSDDSKELPEASDPSESKGGTESASRPKVSLKYRFEPGQGLFLGQVHGE